MLCTAVLHLVATTGFVAAQEASEQDCHYITPARRREAIEEAVRLGRIVDPRLRPLPALPEGRSRSPRSRSVSAGGIPCITTEHIHLYEDSSFVLLSDFTLGEVLALMTEAANDLLFTYGDNFDFIGFWLNFRPDHRIGRGFYEAVQNDVRGIGDPSQAGNPVFNNRPQIGQVGTRVEGYVMMWDVNSSTWQPGSGGAAAPVRLTLAHEFEHRFAVFLPSLVDGRRMQPSPGTCGRVAHWNWRVDAQGSAMEVSEWVGAHPAILRPNSAWSTLLGRNTRFNADIAGGAYSYLDLYLMGYVSGAEMDAFSSEMRFMDTSDCSARYSDSISTFSSADLVATAGPRVPDSTTAQKHWRTGWVMFHLPGDPPDEAELTKAVDILRQHMVDWNHSTLGRGTMDHTLFDVCNTVTPYGCSVNPDNSLFVTDGRPEIGRTITFGVDNPLDTQPAGTLAVLSLALSPDPAFPCGTVLGGFGMDGGPGELLISLARGRKIARLASTWPGAPVEFPVDLPADVSLTGESFFAQGLLLDPTAVGVPRGLTEGLEVVIGP